MKPLDNRIIEIFTDDSPQHHSQRRYGRRSARQFDDFRYRYHIRRKFNMSSGIAGGASNWN
jgi:hypothetical protein